MILHSLSSETYYFLCLSALRWSESKKRMWERTQHWPREHSRWTVILSLFIKKTPFSRSCPKEQATWNYPCMLSGVFTDVIISWVVHIFASSADGICPAVVIHWAGNQVFQEHLQMALSKVTSVSPSLSPSARKTWKSSATYLCGVGLVNSPTRKGPMLVSQLALAVNLTQT